MSIWLSSDEITESVSSDLLLINSLFMSSNICLFCLEICGRGVLLAFDGMASLDVGM